MDFWLRAHAHRLRKYSDSKLEMITTGANVFKGGGKRSDAVMRTKGFVQTLLFAEIKTHRAKLLKPKAYREPVYQVDDEVSGAFPGAEDRVQGGTQPQRRVSAVQP